MMAPAGHVTVTVVKALVAEPHAVEYSDGDDATERLGDREVEGEALEPYETDGEDEGVGGRERDGLAEALTILHCTYRMYVVAAAHAPPDGAVSCDPGRMPHELRPRHDVFATTPLAGSAPTHVPAAKGPDGQAPVGLP
jgi:hypothetical protein